MPSLLYEEYSPILLSLLVAAIFIYSIASKFGFKVLLTSFMEIWQSVLMSVGFVPVTSFEKKKAGLILGSIFFFVFLYTKTLAFFAVMHVWVKCTVMIGSTLLFWINRNEFVPTFLSFKLVQVILYLCLRFEEMILKTSLFVRAVNFAFAFGGLLYFAVVVHTSFPFEVLSIIYLFYSRVIRLFLTNRFEGLEPISKDGSEQNTHNILLGDDEPTWSLICSHMSSISYLAFGLPVTNRLSNQLSRSAFPLVIKRYFPGSGDVGKVAKEVAKDAAKDAGNVWGIVTSIAAVVTAGTGVAVYRNSTGGSVNDPKDQVIDAKDQAIKVLKDRNKVLEDRNKVLEEKDRDNDILQSQDSSGSQPPSTNSYSVAPESDFKRLNTQAEWASKHSELRSEHARFSSRSESEPVKEGAQVEEISTEIRKTVDNIPLIIPDTGSAKSVEAIPFSPVTQGVIDNWKEGILGSSVPKIAKSSQPEETVKAEETVKTVDSVKADDSETPSESEKITGDHASLTGSPPSNTSLTKEYLGLEPFELKDFFL